MNGKFKSCYQAAYLTFTGAVFVGAMAVNSANAANIIYSNLGAASSGSDLEASLSPNYNSFTSAAFEQILIGLELALSGPGGTGIINIGLYNDSNTSPGTLVTTLGTINDSSIISGVNDYSLSLNSNPVLAPSTRYWIGLLDTTGTEGWSYSIDISGTGVAGQYWKSAGTSAVIANGNTIDTAPYQMLVTTSPVPEPTTLALTGFGGLTALVIARRRK